MLNQDDTTFMKRAIIQAREAAYQGEVPIGAIAVTSDFTILGKAHNQVEQLKDATAHAEMIVLTQAAAAIGDWRLQDVSLFVTKEPCPMCAGAMINAKLGRLIYGCRDPKYGAAGSALQLLDFPDMLHKVPVTAGVLEEECLSVIQAFFQQRRQEAKQKRVNQWGEN